MADAYRIALVNLTHEGNEARRERDKAFEILRSFVAHYPSGINPYLDAAYNEACALLRRPESSPLTLSPVQLEAIIRADGRRRGAP